MEKIFSLCLIIQGLSAALDEGVWIPMANPEDTAPCPHPPGGKTGLRF